MGMAGHSRNGTGRNAALGDLVALIVSVGSIRSICAIAVRDQLAAIDRRIEVQVARIDAQPSLGKQEIAEHDARTLEAICDVEDFGNDLEAVSDIERRPDDSRIITKRSAEHLPKIALLRFCWHPSRRARALAVDDDDWSLHHRGHAKPLAHQRESAA